MKIAIDLNDVIRDFSPNFLKYYLQGYNHEFNLDDFEFWSNDMRKLFNFTSDKSYYNFIYNDYVFELYGKCGTCSPKMTEDINEWVEKTVGEYNSDEDIELMIVSPNEYGLSIGNSYYFISKLGIKIREVYFPLDSKTIWDRCDVLVTANPDLISIKPEGKISVKIVAEYNKETDDGDFNYKTLKSFMSSEDNITMLFEKKNKKK